MKFEILKIKKYLLIALLIVFVTCIGYYLYIQSKPSITQNEPMENKHIVPARPKTFEDSSKSLLSTIKSARFAAYRYDAKQVKYYINESLILWRDTVNEFINTPPKENEPDKWIGNVTKIYETILSAEKSINSNDYVETIKNLDKCHALLSEVYDIPKNNPEQHRLFPILLLIDKIKETKTLDEAKPILSEIKINYTLFKELSENQDTKNKILQFENAISEIENATPIMFPLAIENIEPAFFDIYMLY